MKRFSAPFGVGHVEVLSSIGAGHVHKFLERFSAPFGADHVCKFLERFSAPFGAGHLYKLL